MSFGFRWFEDSVEVVEGEDDMVEERRSLEWRRREGSLSLTRRVWSQPERGKALRKNKKPKDQEVKDVVPEAECVD